MEALRRWPEELGLGHQAEVFASNDVDLDVPTELDDQDLKQLGLSLGQRRKLMKAVAALEELDRKAGTT